MPTGVPPNPQTCIIEWPQMWPPVTPCYQPYPATYRFVATEPPPTPRLHPDDLRAIIDGVAEKLRGGG